MESGRLVNLEKLTGYWVPRILGIASPKRTSMKVTTTVHTTNSSTGWPVKSNSLSISRENSNTRSMFTILLAWRMVPRRRLGCPRRRITLRLEESSPSFSFLLSFGLREKNAASLPLIIAEQKSSSRINNPMNMFSHTDEGGISSGEPTSSISIVLGGSKYQKVLVSGANI